MPVQAPNQLPKASPSIVPRIFHSFIGMSVFPINAGHCEVYSYAVNSVNYSKHLEKDRHNLILLPVRMEFTASHIWLMIICNRVKCCVVGAWPLLCDAVLMTLPTQVGLCTANITKYSFPREIIQDFSRNVS